MKDEQRHEEVIFQSFRRSQNKLIPCVIQLFASAEIKSYRTKTNFASRKHWSSINSDTENVTFTMGSFFPLSSVKVRNIHSNGSGFVDITNNSNADEEMTSNDTVLVSNETETDIFANETTPQYVLMSQPLLTLNDSRSGLGRTTTLFHPGSNATVKKTELLSRVSNKTKMAILISETRTLAVDTSVIASFETQQESSKHLEGLSTPSSQTDSILTEGSSLNSFRLQLQELEKLSTARVQASPVTSNNLPSFTASKIPGKGPGDLPGSLRLQSQTLESSEITLSTPLTSTMRVQSHTIEAGPAAAHDPSLPITLGSSVSLETPKLKERILLESRIQATRHTPSLKLATEKLQIISSLLVPGVTSTDSSERISRTVSEGALMASSSLEFVDASIVSSKAVKPDPVPYKTDMLPGLSAKEVSTEPATFTEMSSSLNVKSGKLIPQITCTFS